MYTRSVSASAVVFGGFCVVALAVTLPSGAMLNFVSGTWIALGVDLRQGVFYRPLISDAGFGGTRYFPLWFMLHAGLMAFGLSPLVAGHLISLVAAAVWITGAYRLMRELSLPRELAYAFSILSLCTNAGVLALTTVRGDLLPAALNLWGLAFTARAFRDERSGAAIAAAAGFFVFAILAKVTAAYAVLAMAAALALNARPRRALALLGVTLGSSAILLAAANAISDGRMIETLRASAGFGAVLRNYIHAPLGFLYMLVRQDPMSTVITTSFFAGLAVLPRNAWRELPTCAAVGSAAMLIVLNGTPGIDFNHFVDFFGCALIFVGYQIVNNRIHASSATLGLSIAALMSVVFLSYEIKEGGRQPLRAQVGPVRSYLKQMNLGNSPVFSAHALFPAVDGQRSFMIDPHMFRVLRRTDPQFSNVLNTRLAERHFGAVVLESDVQTEVGRSIVADFFGESFLPTLAANYELVGMFRPYFVYRPRLAESR